MGDSRNTNLIVLVAVFLIGLLIGWLVLGWWLFPVSYTTAYPEDLSPESKQAYVAAIAESYQLTGDRAKAVQRLQSLGTQAEVAELASEVIQDTTTSGDPDTASRVAAMANAVGLGAAAAAVQLTAVPAEPSPTLEQPSTPTPEEGQEGGPGDSLQTVCLAALGILLVFGGIALALWLLSRRRSPTADEAYPPDQMAPTPPPGLEYEAPDWEAVEDEVPPASILDAEQAVPAAAARPARAFTREFHAVFTPRPGSYDETFDIEEPDGGYLGECGMTQSEVIAGDDDRVTALEVWLFDKTDIRTITKVLMSDYAYGNQALRDKLASKGDAVLAQVGERFTLAAQTLRLEGEISDLMYNEGESPQHSSFQRLAVRFRVTHA